MDNTYKTQGVILKRWSYREADRMVRIFTRDYGKITARAISARKNYSKLAGHIEPFLVADFFLARSRRHVDILAGSAVVAEFRHLREDLKKNTAANYFVEVVDKLTKEGQADEALYAHTCATLAAINQTSNLLILHAMILKLYKILGYHLELYRCHSCQKELAAALNAAPYKFYFPLSQLECSDCASTELTIKLQPATIKILRFLTREPSPPASHITKLQLTSPQWQELHNFMRALIEYHLGYQLFGEEVLYKVFSVKEA